MDASQGRALVQDISLILGKPLHKSSPELHTLNPESIKKAFRLRAHQCHPDKASSLGFRPEVLSLRFRELNEAHERVLSAWNDGTYQSLLANIETRPEGQSHGVAKTWRPRPHAARTSPGNRESTKTSTWGKSRHESTKEKTTSFYHKGPLPRLSLRLGQYLYYSGRIDWQTMIDALTWQYMNRPLLGQIAKSMGFLLDQHIVLVQRRRKAGEPFGSAATRLGFLDKHKLNLSLGKQRLLNLPLGRYFTERHILTEGQLQSVLLELHRHNIQLRRGV